METPRKRVVAPPHRNPVVGEDDTRPAVPPIEADGKADADAGISSDLANDIASILRAPITRGGVTLQDQVDEEPEPSRESYTQQSYINDPVHEQHFDTWARSSGPQTLPMKDIEIDGTEYVLGYKTCTANGRPYTENLAKLRMEGWEPVPLERLPSYCRQFAFKSDLGDGYYIVKDSILMMIPKALHQRLERIKDQMCNVQAEAAERQFGAELATHGLESRSRPTTRQTFTGRHATAAIQDALEKATGADPQRGRAPASPHQMRGFRVR